jgi:hypothetical protein
MAFSSSITGRLGLDSSDYRKGLQSAGRDFQQFTRGTAAEAESAGGMAGSKFGSALERKMGLKHAFIGLFAALGLNMDKIAGTIAGAIAGGSKEGWQRAGEIADRESELIEKKIESHLAGPKLTEHLQKNLARAIKGPTPTAGVGEGIATTLSTIPIEGKAIGAFARMLGIGKTDAEKLADASQHSVDILEAEAKLEENSAEERKKKIAEETKLDDLKAGELKTEDAINYLLHRSSEVANEMGHLAKGTVQYDEKKVQLAGLHQKLGEHENKRLAAEREHQTKLKELQMSRLQKMREFEIEAADGDKKAGLIKAELARMDKEIAGAAKDQVRQQELINAKTAVELDYRKQILRASSAKKAAEKTLDEAKAERSKMSLTELANVARFGAGQSVTVEDQAEQARQAMQLQKQGEEARVGGNQDQAKALFEQADQLKTALVKSGTVKEAEAPFAEIVKGIEESNKILAEMEAVFKGKFVAQ